MEKEKKLIMMEYLKVSLNLEKNGTYFQALFNLTFLECIEHIRGTKNSNLLTGLVKTEQMLEFEGKKLDAYDIECYKATINKYEKIIRDKKPRKNYKSKKIKK